ncbi:hypothetical protein ACLF3M_20815, partial [Falsiroseomonas sp. HW251]
MVTVKERRLRLAPDGAGEHGSEWAAICSIAAKIGGSAAGIRGQTTAREPGDHILRMWVRRSASG